MQDLEKLFKDQSLRLTNPRREVFEILKSHDQPLFLNQIIKNVSSSDRSSIYRTLEIFEKLDIVQIIPTGFKKRYELSGPFKPHHHHLVCEKCHQIKVIDDPILENQIHDIAEQANYQLIRHHIELTGICFNCQKIL